MRVRQVVEAERTQDSANVRSLACTCRACAFSILVAVFALLSAAPPFPSQISHAQDSENRWPSPQRLNSTCCASYPVPVVDPWGQMHVFWAEQDGFISYIKLIEQRWSSPIEILADPVGDYISWPDVAADQNGFLHVVWISGSTGPLYYSRASAFSADDAQMWADPIEIAEKALGCSIDVDSTGLVHVVYTPFEEGKSLVHVTTTSGSEWSEPDVAESQLGTGWTGGMVRLAIDQQDTLHVAWGSAIYPEAFPPHALFYQHSSDGGQTWSEPYDPDPLPTEVDQDRRSNYKNTLLNVAVGTAEEIHLTWHSHTGSRWHRWSADGGLTWSEKEPIFPNMGAAYNGRVDMAFDSTGRMHMVASRFSVWHQAWSQDSGQPGAEMVDPREPDWHHQRVAVFRGNQVYLFYADVNDTGIIWYTSRTYDAPSLAPAPSPKVAVVPTALATEPATAATIAAPTVLPTTNPSPTDEADSASEPITADEFPLAQNPVVMGIVPAALLIVVVVVLRLAHHRR